MYEKPDYSRTCFVMMPYGSRKVGNRFVDFDRVHDLILDPAVRRVRNDGKRMVPLRADRPQDSRDLVHSMMQDLLRSRLALAELSTENPNVYLELGWRYANVPGATTLVHLKGTKPAFDLAHQLMTEYVHTPPHLVDDSIARIAATLRATLSSRARDDPSYRSAWELADRMGDPAKPTRLGATLVEGETAARAGQPNEAARAYAQAVEIEPNAPMLRQRFGMMLIDAGRTAEAEQQFQTALKLDTGRRDLRRVLGDLRLGKKPALIDLDPLDSPGLRDLMPPGSRTRLDVSPLGETLRASGQTYFNIVPGQQTKGLASHVGVIGGAGMNLDQIRGAVANLGKLKEYPSMYFPEYDRTVWSFDLHTPRKAGFGAGLDDLKDALSTLPGVKKIDFGGGFSGGGGSGGPGGML